MKLSELIYELSAHLHHLGDVPVVVGPDEDGEYHNFSIELMRGHQTLDGRYVDSQSQNDIVKLEMNY